MQYHHNVKCDCGHRQLSHNKEGQCRLCKCPIFSPNINYNWKPKIKGVIKSKGQNDITIEYTPEKLTLTRDKIRSVLIPKEDIIKNYQQDIKQLQTMIKEKQQMIKKLKKL